MAYPLHFYFSLAKNQNWNLCRTVRWPNSTRKVIRVYMYMYILTVEFYSVLKLILSTINCSCSQIFTLNSWLTYEFVVWYMIIQYARFLSAT
jgi:hypothetical protein